MPAWLSVVIAIVSLIALYAPWADIRSTIGLFSVAIALIIIFSGWIGLIASLAYLFVLIVLERDDPYGGFWYLLYFGMILYSAYFVLVFFGRNPLDRQRSANC